MGIREQEHACEQDEDVRDAGPSAEALRAYLSSARGQNEQVRPQDDVRWTSIVTS